MSFNHFDEQGHAVMVDISAKAPTLRRAVASARVALRPETLRAILDQKIAKGDVLSVARLAGIAAAKMTPTLIPLSHPLAIHKVSIDFAPDPDSGSLVVTSDVTAMERSGMEMEAMVAASVAALTVYDMCKGSDKSISLGDIKLLYKEGGKSGVFRREDAQ
ncbi:MAG TPA: cyclic pyranopterin monophosphate synthase MoaC [Geopsychrobacteraceae bacterium]|jgi:cyclic pyranopterin phosphate synthase